MLVKTYGQISFEMKYAFIIGFQWILIQIAAGAVTLSPINPEGLEHEPLTLTCESNESTVTGFVWQSSVTEFVTQKRICIVFNNLTSDRCYFPSSEWEPDPATYGYDCPSRTRHTLTIKNVTSDVGGVKWRCLTYSPNEESNSVKIIVKVPVRSVVLKYPVTTSVTVNETSPIGFRCEVTRSLPSATIQWYHDNKTPGDTDDDVPLPHPQESTLENDDLTFNTTSNMQFTPTRSYNGVHVYCTANNGYETTPKSDRQTLVNVKYSPDGPPVIQGVTINTDYFVIRSTIQVLNCSVNGGNPLANITWNCYGGTVGSLKVSGRTVSRTVTWTVGSSEQQCTCISYQEVAGEQRSIINVKVLYPPDPPRYEVGNATMTPLSEIRIVKNRAVEITCNSVSNPAPSVWRWGSPPGAVIQAPGKVLVIHKPQLTHAGVYTCDVENTMVPSQGASVKGINNSSVNIEVLYPPSVGLIERQILVEGGNLTVNCPVQPGNPFESTIKWTRREGSNPTSTTNILNLVAIQRNQSDYYTCTATNRIHPSGCDPEDGSDVSEFYIDVQYKASIESFRESSKPADVVTLNQGDPLNITCNVDSNPLSNISIRKGSGVLNTTQAGRTLSYSEEDSSCETNMGVYYCFGKNEHNSGTVNKTLAIFIRCGPRVPKAVTLISNVTSDTNVSATMSFTVVAYPASVQYVWEKIESETSQHTLKNDSKITIVKSEDGLQSNITITNMQQSDFGEYRVTARNNIGSTFELFYLVPQAKPETPKGFTFRGTTVSSVILSWIPGFNGGLPQKIIIQYKRKTDARFGYFIEIQDTGVYNETITDLSAGTEYEANIHAINSIGSSGNMSIFFTTLLQNDPPKSPLGLIGGAVGGTLLLVLVAVVLVVIWRIRMSKNASNDRDSLTHGQKLRSISKSNKSNTDDDLPDEVENPMYIRSDDVEGTGQGADVVYSQPKKKIAEIKVTNDVYAVVNKKTHQTDTDVYENADDMSSRCLGRTSKGKTRPSKTKEKKTNKEGLVYADLVFSNPPKGQKRLVIHGLDDMTEYAEVDLTRKADPLPDSDDEDKKT